MISLKFVYDYPFASYSSYWLQYGVLLTARRLCATNVLTRSADFTLDSRCAIYQFVYKTLQF